jgi:hypothetical protein
MRFCRVRAHSLLAIRTSTLIPYRSPLALKRGVLFVL